MEEDLDEWNPMDEHYRDEYSELFGGGYGRPSLPRRPNLRSPSRYSTNGHVVHIRCSAPYNDKMTLVKLFERCGNILSVDVLNSGEDRSVAQVKFSQLTEAVEAIKRFHRVPPYYMTVEHQLSDSRQLQTFRGQTRRGNHTREPYFQAPRLPQRTFYVEPDDLPLGNLTIKATTGSERERTVIVANDRVRCHTSPIPPDVVQSVGSDIGGCLHCGNDVAFRCVCCKGCYCSRECQRKDWVVHRKMCRSAGASPTERSSIVDPHLATDGNSRAREQQLHSTAAREFNGTSTPVGAESRSAADGHRGARPKNNARRPQPTLPPVSVQNSSVDVQAVNARGGGCARKETLSTASGSRFRVKAEKPIQNVELPCDVSSRPTPTTIKMISSIPRFILQLNVPTKVVVRHIVDPSSFFVQVVDQRHCLAEMMRTLQSVIVRYTAPDSLSLDQMVAAKFTDGVWYRAVVKDVKRDATVSVCYIDYGNVETIVTTDVRCLPNEFASFPLQAVLCGLPQIQPLGNTWTPADLETFRLFVSVELTAVFSEVVDGRHSTQLLDDNGADVGHLLYESGHARPTMRSCVSLWEAGQDTSFGFTARNSECELWFLCTTSKEDVHNVSVISDESVPIANSTIEVGALICARSPADEALYRAVVRKASEGEITVQYLDFGNCEAVTEIYYIPKEQYGIRSLAVLFCFNSEAETEIVHEHFTSGEMIMIAKVVEVGPETGKVVMTVGDEMVHATVYSVVHSRFTLSEAAAALPPNADDVLHAEVFVAGPSVHVTTPPPMERPLNAIVICDFPVPTEETSAVVLNVEAVDSVFVRVATEECLLMEQEMIIALNDFYHNDLEAIASLPCVGDLACAKFTADNEWYRCRVAEIFSHDKVVVFYIDFGNRELLPLIRIKPLLPQFTTVPALALRVKLDLPADADIDELKTMLMGADGQTIVWSMAVLDATTSPLTVKLFRDDRPLTDRSIDGELGDSLVMPTVQSLSSPQAVVVNTALLTAPAVEQPTATPVVEAIVPSTSTQASRMGVDCRIVELQVGTRVNLGVVAAFPRGCLQCCIPQEELLAAVDELTTKMTEWYETKNVPQFLPVIGSMCAAKSSEDGLWYRARVVLLQANESYVFYVDFGNSELVSNSVLHPLLQEFCELPLQVVDCKLNEYNYSDQSVAAVNELLRSKIYLVDVVAQEDNIYIIHNDQLAQFGSDPANRQKMMNSLL